MENVINKKIILTISAIIAILLLTIGVTFAYFAAQSSTTAQTITSGTLSISFTSTNVLRTQNILPITEDQVDAKATELNFSVKNTGNITGYFDISLTDIVIDKELKNPDFKWRLLESDIVKNEGDFQITSTQKILIHNISIEPDTTKTYKLLVWLNETNKPQNEMQGKSLTAKVTVNSNDRVNGFALSENPVLENTVENGVISNLRMYGNSVQNGIPTPETPVEIQSVGERTINILPYPYDETTKTVLGVSYVDNGDGSISVSGTSTDWSSFTLSKLKIELEAGKKYYLKNNGDSTNVLLIFAYDDETGTKKYNGNGVTWSDEYSNPLLYLQVNPNKTVTGKVYPYLVEESDNSKDYEPYGYKIPVKASGKNLYENLTIVSNKYIDNNGVETDSTNLFRTDYFNVIGNNQYSLKFSTTHVANIVAFSWFDENKKFISRTASNQITGENLEFKATAPSNAKYAICNIIKDSTEISIREEIITNIYLDEPLRAIGDYKDYIDFESGKVVRKVYNQFITKVNSVSSDVSPYKKIISNISKKPLIKSTNPNSTSVGDTMGYAISNKFKRSEVNYNNLGKYPNLIQSYITTSGGYRIVNTFDDSSITTVAQANEKIGNGFDVYYVLETPTEETIELPTITTLAGTTTLSANTTVQPSFEGSY